MNTPADRFFYRDHMLSCAPCVLDDGTFQARVAITAMGGLKTQAQRFLDLDVFDTREAATRHAHAAGMAWIDKHVPAGTP